MATSCILCQYLQLYFVPDMAVSIAARSICSFGLPRGECYIGAGGLLEAVGWCQSCGSVLLFFMQSQSVPSPTCFSSPSSAALNDLIQSHGSSALSFEAS